MIDAALPRWTLPSFQSTPGRYPLGLEAVALSQLAGELASGLPVLSRHPRYWSIYAWIVHQFSQSGLPKTNRALGAFLKPREAVFACAAYLHHWPEELPNIIGRETFVPSVRAHIDGEFPIPTNYLQQGLGGYGQVYRGAMRDLGLVLLAENNPRDDCDVPFGEIGIAVAEAFADAIAGTDYARRYAGDEHLASIPIDVLRELGPASCFCRLTGREPERAQLTDVVLGKVQPPNRAHADRAATVRMFLDLAAATDGHALDQDRFRDLVYYGATAEGARWTPRPDVGLMHRRWLILQARDLLVRALNALFVDFARWGVKHGGLIEPLSLWDYAARLDRLNAPGELDLGRMPLTDVTLRNLVQRIDTVVSEHGWPPSTAALTASLNERKLVTRIAGGTSDETPADAFCLSLLVLRRLELLRSDTEPVLQAMLAEGGYERIATQVLQKWLRRSIEKNQSVSASLLEFVRAFVIRQHMRVAGQKLSSPPYQHTYRFSDRGASFSFFDHHDEGLAPVSIRFEAIDAALSGLGLLTGPLSTEAHGPTAKGLDILNG